MSGLVFVLGRLSGENGTKKCYDPKSDHLNVVAPLAGARQVSSPVSILRATKICLAHKIIGEQVLSRIAQDNLACLQDIATISQAESH